MSHSALSIRIDLPSGLSLGPGKIALLEAVKATGSISGASRSTGISYRKTWLMIDEINQAMREPVVTTAIGGNDGGGAVLTPTGEKIIDTYHQVQSRAAEATRDDCRAIERLSAKK
jgi:molybdate transport system regulatory protein